MSILSGFKKYKDYILTSSGYQLSSRWTKSDAVVMGDGTDDTNTLEKNLGSIQGITDSLTATSSNVALSAAGGNNLQSQIDTLNSNLNKNFEVLKKVTSPHTITLDITDYREFLMGRANDKNVLNDIITFDKAMLSACDVEIATSGVVIAKATLSGNILTVNLTTLVSGYFYLFGR